MSAFSAWIRGIGKFFIKSFLVSISTEEFRAVVAIHIYLYVSNDPVNWIDPRGLQGTIALPPPIVGAAGGTSTATAGGTVAGILGPLSVLVGGLIYSSPAGEGSDIVPLIVNNHSANEEALKDMLEKDTKKGDPNHPLSKEDADAALDLADELGLPNRDHRSPQDAQHYDQQGKYPNGIPHIHIDGLSGKLRHIPACP